MIENRLEQVGLMTDGSTEIVSLAWWAVSCFLPNKTSTIQVAVVLPNRGDILKPWHLICGTCWLHSQSMILKTDASFLK